MVEIEERDIATLLEESAVIIEQVRMLTERLAEQQHVAIKAVKGEGQASNE